MFSALSTSWCISWPQSSCPCLDPSSCDSVISKRHLPYDIWLPWILSPLRKLICLTEYSGVTVEADRCKCLILYYTWSQKPYIYPMRYWPRVLVNWRFSYNQCINTKVISWYLTRNNNHMLLNFNYRYMYLLIEIRTARPNLHNSSATKINQVYTCYWEGDNSLK